MARLRAKALLLLGTLSASLLTGCERKAPGPEECTQFAEAVTGAQRTSPWLTPELQAAVEVETRRCLTAPYDRELFRCVLATRQARLCLTSFQLRKGQPG